jgi:phosphopantothenate-cysteine ligase/phosphopantothenoylcysteine decarboxylase/phosphopantothenate--cysteine ligase
MKRILVTAGNTLVPIDQVRAITNIFKGRTGSSIALAFALESWDVTLVTSNPQLLPKCPPPTLKVRPYRTYHDLAAVMEEEITNHKYDAIIHSAAVSDYHVAEVLHRTMDGGLGQLSNSHKVSSSHDELMVRLVPTEKLVDKVRLQWGFRGKLVKFKLEVGVTDIELQAIARKSMQASHADMIVANCLEWSSSHAFILESTGLFAQKVSRQALPDELLRRLS